MVDEQEVVGGGDHVDPAAGDPVGQQVGVGEGYDGVMLRRHDQRGVLDLVQPRQARPLGDGAQLGGVAHEPGTASLTKGL